MKLNGVGKEKFSSVLQGSPSWSKNQLGYIYICHPELRRELGVRELKEKGNSKDYEKE